MATTNDDKKYPVDSSSIYKKYKLKAILSIENKFLILSKQISIILKIIKLLRAQAHKPIISIQIFTLKR